jgi:hypothetical protein
MSTIARMLVVGTVALTLAPTADAQQWRDMQVSRQLRDTSEQRVKVQYGAGTLTLGSAPDAMLYQMDLRYDEDAGRPIYSFDSSTHVLTVGLEKQSMRLVRGMRNNQGELRLDLTRQAPLDLSLDLGAVKGDLDVSGFKLTRLELESGAADIRVRADTLNPVAMSLFNVDVGAASVRIDNVANLNAKKIRASVGVGELQMDFSGEWTQDVDATIDVALGHLDLRVPSDVGIRVEIERFLSGFDKDQFRKRGDAYYSRNYDDAKYHLELKINAALGNVDISHR